MCKCLKRSCSLANPWQICARRPFIISILKVFPDSFIINFDYSSIYSLPLLNRLRLIQPKRSRKIHPRMWCAICISVNCAWTFALVNLVTDLHEPLRYTFTEYPHVLFNKFIEIIPHWIESNLKICCLRHSILGVGTIDWTTASFLKSTLHRSFIRYSS